MDGAMKYNSKSILATVSAALLAGSLFAADPVPPTEPVKPGSPGEKPTPPAPPEPPKAL